MLDVDAALLIAVVLAAGSLLLAALLAACVIGLAGQVSTGDFSIHVTASTLDIGAQVAVWTFVHVTKRLACVRITCARKREESAFAR